MYTRIRDSIVNPKQLLMYRKDHFLRVLAYILFFSLLFTTTSIIDVIRYQGISQSLIDDIEMNFNEVDPSCEIKEAVFTCDSAQIQEVYKYVYIHFYLDSSDDFSMSNYSKNQYNIVINDSHMYFYYGIGTALRIPLTEFPDSVQNIDFATQQTDSELFYSQIVKGINDTAMSTKITWAPMVIVFQFLISIFTFMVFILIGAWFMKMRFKIVPFGELFRMTVYASTALYLVLIFNTMIPMNMVFLIVLIFVAFRQNNILAAEIEKRIQILKQNHLDKKD